MLLRCGLSVLLAVAFTRALPTGTKNIQRFGNSRDVNLVEFAIGETIHGKCSFVDKSGRDVKLIYEETKDIITARSLNPSVVDPAAAVKECRVAATEVPKTAEVVEGRGGMVAYGNSPIEIEARLRAFKRASHENLMYANQLNPRILTWLGQGLNGLGSFSTGNSANSNFGLSWGNYGDSSFANTFPGVNLMAPTNNVNQNTVTYGSSNPFDFLYGNTDANTGAWGVLNSLNANNGGFFPFFSGFNPFSTIG